MDDWPGGKAWLRRMAESDFSTHPSAWWVGRTLLQFCNRDGLVTISLEQISKLSMVSYASARRSCLWLDEIGWIDYRPRHPDGVVLLKEEITHEH